MAAIEHGSCARSRELASNAEAKSAMWLNRGREADEQGKSALAEECYQKAGEWLDRANELRGLSRTPIRAVAANNRAKARPLRTPANAVGAVRMSLAATATSA